MGNRIVWIMFRLAMVLVFAIYFSAGIKANNPESGAEPVLVRVYTSFADSRVGTLVSDDANKITIHDIKTDVDVTIEKSGKLKIDQPISLDDDAKYSGLATVVGWKLSQMAAREKPTGKVASITPQVVYVTMGEDSKVRVGQSLNVYLNNGDIIDPETGEVLGSERSRIAQLEIVEVPAKLSKAKLTSDLEVKLLVGDDVEPTKQEMVVGVCPIRNDYGSLTMVGTGLAEDITTILVQRKVSVVERSAIGAALKELLVQNTVLFDEKSAQEIGKLTGANVVLTGKIVPTRSSDTAYLRLTQC